MDLEDLLPALQVRKLHGNAPVKSSRTGQRRVQGFGAVCRRQYDDAVVLLKTVHLREQLVQSLFALVISSDIAAISLLTDGIDLIDKDDTGGFFLCLFKQIPDLGSAHAHEHLHKFGAGHGEERDIRLTGYSLCQHRFTGSGRADKQYAFRHGCTDRFVLVRIMQVIDDLRKVLLRFILTGNIAELDAFRGLDVNAGVGFSHAEHHGIGAAGLIHHLF